MAYNPQAPNVFTFAGTPNGSVAGNAGVSNGAPPDFCWNVTNSNLYVCVTTGSTSTAVWDLVAAFAAPLSIASSATLTPNFSYTDFVTYSLATNATLAVPTNITPGVVQSGCYDIWQDATGSRLLATAWIYTWSGGTAGSLSTVAGSHDALFYRQVYYGTSTVTVTIAAPGVVTWTAHGLNTFNRLQLTTTGALPTGLAANTTYWVTKVDANSFKLSTSLANAVAGTFITTTGSQSGVHTAVAGEIELTINQAFS